MSHVQFTSALNLLDKVDRVYINILSLQCVGLCVLDPKSQNQKARKFRVSMWLGELLPADDKCFLKATGFSKRDYNMARTPFLLLRQNI